MENFNIILAELSAAGKELSQADADRLLQHIQKAKKVFVAGAGRTGFMSKSFCMRLMHMGVDSYVLGETVVSNFEAQDLIILASGSGETQSLISYANKAKTIGGTIIVVTIKPESSLAKLADFVIKMPGAVKDYSPSSKDIPTIQPMGSLFEQCLLLFYDAVILDLMAKNNLDSTKMYGKHANLE
ncbi:MAG: 6-phospho-3-hexuloisomerase [Defluviitaleaceae bacterium]|nr:6-phospho-3-hexuloisomerase [Defluviitaleaceae bacterium]